MEKDLQKHVEIVLKKCLEVYPANKNKHNKFIKSLVDNGDIPKKMSKMIIKIIKNPNCNYTVKSDGTLKIDTNE